MVRSRVQYPVPGLRLQEHAPYKGMFPPANENPRPADGCARAGIPRDGARRPAARIETA